MKSKTSLMLLELALMLLVFSLAAALCLQGFLWADNRSQQVENQDAALLQAQNTAELLRHTGGDFPEAARLLGATLSEGSLILETEELRLTAAPVPTDTALLGSACITVTDPQDHVLFQLTVYYQEDTP